MNPHYHHPSYPDLVLKSEPHSPSGEGMGMVGGSGGGVGGGYYGHAPNPRTAMPPNGHLISHEHLHQHHPAFAGGPQHHQIQGGPNPNAMHHHHHHHHHLLNNNNNNNNNSNNNNNNNGSGGGGNNQNCGANAKECGGCGSKIMERYLLLAMDRYWHNACLKCSSCGTNLGDIGNSCFTRDNMILCKNDYIRMYVNKSCARCGLLISPNEFVMKTGGSSGGGGGGGSMGGSGVPSPVGSAPHQFFHVRCFVCTKCEKSLNPGDRYYLPSGTLVCEQDWHKILKGSGVGTQANPAATPIRKGKVGRPRRSRD